jgi:hypothetical protein
MSTCSSTHRYRVRKLLGQFRTRASFMAGFDEFAHIETF